MIYDLVGLILSSFFFHKGIKMSLVLAKYLRTFVS